MITEAHNNSKYKFIRLGDLGLCRLANETSSSGAYGVLPFIAPEVLNKYQYSQASDIYSVGIIMWIISTGKIPFANRAYNAELSGVEIDIKVIHSKGFVHSDLHPGNLMITEAHNNSKYKFIRLGDLGLCRLANETSSSGAYGVLPFIAPEVLNKYQYSQASDIYSVGIIMWIISTGKIPFANRAYNAELSVDILNGLRPKISDNIPQCYAELMELCWHKDPAERPSAEMIYIRSENWINELLYDLKTDNSLMFLNAEQKMQYGYEDEDLSSIVTTHAEAYITSKPLPSVDFNIDNLLRD
ncbi:hypothetical protein Glove_383g10 [Diversispora epigaea]|uniref:Protein kinase domain-containing protein n=1 Tax=Diversispora epigaea TaxID=1348612 RepID=A0A397H842_9GLOM|nr:hypothetical protein Glove_383g10 [Diversispora epigaea]